MEGVLIVRRSLFLIQTLALVLATSVAGAGHPSYHRVRNGESLSQIALLHYGYPIYSKNGSLSKILAINPEIANADWIRVGQTIRIQRSETVETPLKTSTMASSPVAHEKTSPTQAAPNTTEDSPLEFPNHRFFLALSHRFTQLNAQDPGKSRARLESGRDLGAEAAWSQAWSDSFTSEASFGIRSLAIQPSTSPSRNLLNTGKTLFSLYMKGEKKILRGFWINLSGGIEQELFMHARDASNISIDSIAVPNAIIGIRVELLKRKDLSLGARLDLSKTFGSSSDSYEVRGGRSTGLGLYLLKASGRRSYELGLGLSRRSQDTSILEIDENHLYAHIRFGLPIFDE